MFSSSSPVDTEVGKIVIEMGTFSNNKSFTLNSVDVYTSDTYPTKFTGDNLINSNYHVEGDMVVSYSFPSNYANNNSSTSVSINRDYGKLIDNNVSYKAVNEYANIFIK